MTTIRMSSLLDRNIIASDGAVGALYDIYFSDDTWVVEHIILQTGAFFESRRLIMDPGLLLAESGIDGGSTTSDILVATTRKEILASPDYMADPPVSEQRSHDAALHPRFLWFPTGDMTKVVLRPLGADEDALTGSSETSIAEGHNPRLQSFREVRGYAVHTATGEEDGEQKDLACIGHVADLLFTPGNQHIEQVIIDTGHGPTRDELMVQPSVVRSIEWADVHMYLRLTRAELGLAVG